MEEVNNKQELIEYIERQMEDERRYVSYADGNNGGRRLENYDQFAKEFARCRDHKKGRKISASFRLFKHDSVQQGVTSYVVNLEGYGSQPFMRITPDNVVEFVAPPSAVWQHSQSIVSSSYRWIPFMFERHKKGLYRVQHTGNHAKRMAIKLENWFKNKLEQAKLLSDDVGEAICNDFRSQCYMSTWSVQSRMMKESPAYFQGLKFNIITGECLNRRPDDKFVEKADERKVWRQALAKFKRGIKARAKVRAFDPLIEKIWAERQGQSRYHWKQPDWSSKPWLDLLEQSIRDNEFPKELLLGFCATPSSGYYQQSKPTSKEVFDGVHKILTDMSVELRRRFNVFEKEGHDEKREEKYQYTFYGKNTLTIEEVSKL
tara:strand:- start:10575 stop:11696 length:1122 start_codon:yes stop_codon:yes gene_type:complete